jgi:hypothetical protein
MMNTARIDISPEYLKSQGLSPTFEERFWSRVYIDTAGIGCWLWTGHQERFGHGRLYACYPSTFMILAHRASWILNYGPVPDGLCVLHKCDNPPCVRPDHLFLGTIADNNDDRDRKGRHVTAHGESVSNHVLTEKQVLQIRAIYAAGTVSQLRLAIQFQCSEKNIFYIVHRQHWPHI